MPPRFADGRHEAILAGLKSAGLELAGAAERADVLVTWNLHRPDVQREAAACEARGGAVVVCEEAYTRRLSADRRIAVALHGHNGSGSWYPDGPARWRGLGLEIAPWRRGGDVILVCASRGMGSPLMREPGGWADMVRRRLQAMTPRPVRLRRHPGRQTAIDPLARDLADAWAVVVWASNCATEALLAGVPVFYAAPHIITAGAAERGLAGIARPSFPERLPVFERLAWAQWSLEEVAAGEPFRHLLCRRPQAEVATAL